MLQSPLDEDEWMIPRVKHTPNEKVHGPNEGRLILLTDDVADSG